MFDPEQIEGSVWVLGFEGEGDRYFECSRVFEYEDKQYALMFSLYESEIAELESEEKSEPCGCSCEHDDEEETCEECCSDEEEERDFTVVRLVSKYDGELDIVPLTVEEEKDESLEELIEEVLEDIEEEYEAEDEEEEDKE